MQLALFDDTLYPLLHFIRFLFFFLVVHSVAVPFFISTENEDVCFFFSFDINSKNG